MTVEKNQSTCPESTVDSAFGKNSGRNPVLKQGNRRLLVCESTIESANGRRDFIKKAALITSAAAVGSTILGNTAGRLIPESTARSDLCRDSGCGVLVKCNIVSYGDVIVDGYNLNNGTLNPSASWGWTSIDSFGDVLPPQHALTFGTCCFHLCCYDGEANQGGYLSGEAIASARTCGAQNKNGLDFYTNRTKRVSITNCGYVGINTCTPGTRLYVNGDASFHCSVYINTGKQNTGTICYALRFGGGCSGQGIGSNRDASDPNPCGIDFYTDSQKRLSITNSGYVGIGTFAPSSTLDVAGTVIASTLEIIEKCTAEVPIVARGAGCQSAHLQEWQNSLGSALAYVSECGSIKSTPSCTGPGVNAIFGSAASGAGIKGSSASGIGVFGQATGAGAVPFLAQGAAGQTANSSGMG